MNTRPLWLCGCSMLLGAPACFEEPGNVATAGDSASSSTTGEGTTADGTTTQGTTGEGTTTDGTTTDGTTAEGTTTDTNGACDGATQMSCSGECVDVAIDNAHCGGCGVACPAFELCGESTCKPEKYVFVTTARYQGNLGLAEADEICTTTANDNFLEGSYRAWLSSESSSPSAWTVEDGVYRLRGDADTVVAYSWSQLLGGNLAAPIDVDQTGTPIAQSVACDASVLFAVWTGTSESGTALDETCDGWTSSGQASTGRVGNASSTDASWTASRCSPTCDFMYPIYCVEL
jgi:Stigma-specific protein, Stig1